MCVCVLVCVCRCACPRVSVRNRELSLSGGFTPSRHLRPSAGREQKKKLSYTHTLDFKGFAAESTAQKRHILANHGHTRKFSAVMAASTDR